MDASDASKEARLKALTQELAELLYEDTDPEQVTPLAGIEEAVRGHLLARIGPEIGNFLSRQAAAPPAGDSVTYPALSDD